LSNATTSTTAATSTAPTPSAVRWLFRRCCRLTSCRLGRRCWRAALGGSRSRRLSERRPGAKRQDKTREDLNFHDAFSYSLPKKRETMCINPGHHARQLNRPLTNAAPRGKCLGNKSNNRPTDRRIGKLDFAIGIRKLEA
jgi:hypothetical protein